MEIFRASEQTLKTNIVNENNMVNNPNWQEADKLAIFKHSQGAGFRTTTASNTILWRQQDLNPQPPDFKCSAVTTLSGYLPTVQVKREKRAGNLKKMYM